MNSVFYEEPPAGTEPESAPVPTDCTERTAPSRQQQPSALLSAARCTASSMALAFWDALSGTNTYTRFY